MKQPNTSGYAPVNGINMYYELYGEGSIPLVLIHGGGSTLESSFGNILPLLAEHNAIIAVELQAHGRTSDRDSPESFDQDAEDVAALLKHLKINKANFLGFSNGGTTTLHIAVKHPDIVHKIIVVSANYKKEGLIPGFFNGFAEATLEQMPVPLREGYLKVSGNKNGLQTMFEKDKQRMLNYKDMSDDELRSIKAPALLMVADHDVITAEHVIKMSQLISNSQLVILPGIHGSFIGEVCSAKKGSRLPKITAALVEEFLSE